MKSKDKMSLASIVIVAMNAMVGASIFTLPVALSLSVGPAAIMSYIIVIFFTLIMALAFARVENYYPSPCPVYTHSAKWGGPLMGYISSLWYITGLLFMLGLIARIAGIYMHDYISFLPSSTLTVSSIWCFVGFNFLGTSFIYMVQYIFIILTIVPIFFIMILCARFFSFSNYTPFAPYGIKSIILASQAVVSGFFGFEIIPMIESGKNNINKKFSKAMVITIVLTGLIYVLFIGAIFGAIPASAFVNIEMPLSHALRLLYPGYTWLGFIIDWAVIVTIWGTLLSMIMSISSLIKTLFKVHYIFSLFLVGCVVSLIGVFFNSIKILFALVAFCMMISYAMSVVTLLIKAKNKKDILLGFLGVTVIILIIYCAINVFITSL